MQFFYKQLHSQGPCGAGYHIPELGERQRVVSTLSGSGNTVNTLHIPLCGNLSFGTGTRTGTDGYLRTNTPYEGHLVRVLHINDTAYNVGAAVSIGTGLSLRAFKNEPAIPDETWTETLTGKAWENAELGLVSVKVGDSYITIKNKNEGATEVYTSGAEFSQANCGKFFQWGNDYGFPFTGATSTSTTQVDVTGYGPKNHYSSSTFIKSTQRMSTVDHNLWGHTDYTNDTPFDLKTPYLGNREIKNIHLGTRKIRPNDIINITYTEGSSSAFVHTYGGDAVGWETGSDKFDEFFGYKPVLLDVNGNETAELDPNDFTKDINGNAVNITSGDNVMIKFPIRGIKATKNGSQITISLTKRTDAESDGYSYYAFSRGTFDTPIKKDCFYIGAYEGYFNGGVMKSRSGKTPTCAKTHAEFMEGARANDSNTGDAGYEYQGFYQRDYINALYMLKYGNGDSQTVLGQGIVSGSKTNTGTTNNKGMNYGTQTQREAIKLFGIENYRGNCYEYVGGCCTDGEMNFYTALSHFTGDITTTGDYYQDSGIDVPSSTSLLGRSKTAGTNKGIFAPVEANGTQYNDYFNAAASRLFGVFGYWNSGTGAGVFSFYLNRPTSSAPSYVASRLMYL